jgi:bacterioferritin (cytochrome b1)
LDAFRYHDYYRGVIADPGVLNDLNAACSLLATIIEQYRVDGMQIKVLGLKSLGHKFYPKWHQALEEHLNRFIRQILRFNSDPAYQVGAVTTRADLRALLTADVESVTRCFGMLCNFRKKAWNSRADAVPDEYEHAVQDLQSQIEHMEEWLKLIAGLGPQDFIGALVEV